MSVAAVGVQRARSVECKSRTDVPVNFGALRHENAPVEWTAKGVTGWVSRVAWLDDARLSAKQRMQVAIS